MDDEKEVLQAIYEDAFEARVHPRDGCTVWRIRLEGFGAAVSIKLPKVGYPETSPPSSLAVDFDEWPAGADAFSARVYQEVQPTFMAGQDGCVFAWVEHVREALGDAPELTGGTAAAAADAVAAAVGAAAVDENTGPGVGVAPIAPSAVEAVQSSLVKAGFSSCGPGVYSHGKQGITVEVRQELTITVDGIDAEDLSDWATMQLQENSETFGEHLCVWAVAQREEGFSEEVAEEAAQGLDFLPSPAELGVDTTRELLIYTWGKALRKAAPPDSGCNFNAGILNGRGGGADLRTMNGLSDEVQNNVASCGLFPRWITMVCHKVEHSNLNCISINCTKGRHRSVAAAEILKKVFYPQATTRHLTIY